MLTDRPSLICLRAAVLALVLAFGMPHANAATIIARSDVELTEMSDAVVVATVERVAFERAEDGSLQTRHTLTVESWWTGQGPSTIDVLQTGGEADGVKQALNGDFKLHEGKRVVMFLRQGPDAWYSTLLSWSVFDITGSGITATVQRQGGDLALKKRGADGLLHDVARSDEPQSLGGLKVNVQVLGRKGVK